MLEAMSDAGGVIGAAASGIEAGIAKDLAAAAAAGDNQRLKVDLQALYDYYFKVKTVHENFQHALSTLPDEPFSSQVLEVSRIQGVTDSVQTTVVQALTMYSGSLKRSAAVVSARLASHLCKIAETYQAYLQVDDQKAAELESAGATGAGDIGYGGGSRTAAAANELRVAGAAVAALGL